MSNFVVSLKLDAFVAKIKKAKYSLEWGERAFALNSLFYVYYLRTRM